MPRMESDNVDAGALRRPIFYSEKEENKMKIKTKMTKEQKRWVTEHCTAEVWEMAEIPATPHFHEGGVTVRYGEPDTSLGETFGTVELKIDGKATRYVSSFRGTDDYIKFLLDTFSLREDVRKMETFAGSPSVITGPLETGPIVGKPDARLGQYATFAVRRCYRRLVTFSLNENGTLVANVSEPVTDKWDAYEEFVTVHLGDSQKVKRMARGFDASGLVAFFATSLLEMGLPEDKKAAGAELAERWRKLGVVY